MFLFVILSAAILTGLTATTMFTTVPAFADKKKCEDNDNNNCNDTHKTQKIDQENKCKIENENKDHSSDNGNENRLACVNIGANLNGVLVAIGDVFGTDNVKATSANNNQGQQ
jgi:hypothetical protein